MKKLITIFTILFLITSVNSISQWLSDDNLQQGPEDQEPVPTIQFLNQNTGWVVHPLRKDSVYKTTNSGLNWIGYSTGDTNGNSGLYFINSTTGWVVGKRGKIAKSTNGGMTWILQSSGISSWLNAVHFYDVNTGIAVGSKDSNRVILKTTNGGTNWQILNRSNQSRLYSVRMTGSQTVYCVGDSGKIIYSTNGGINWTNQLSGSTSTLRDIIFKNYGPFVIGWIAGKNGTLLTTSNGGTNWTSRSFNSTNFYGIDFGSADTGYISGTGKIYKTINGGLNWFQQTTPVPDTINIKDIFCIDSKNVWAIPWLGNLIYTTNGGGSTGILPISNEIPSGFSLHQNYPNPFNPITKIRFDIPKSSLTKLTVFDITGRVMAILINEELKSGIYEVEWDASHRASGVYFYKLETESYSETKKLVLIK